MCLKMAKVKWKSKSETERELKEQEAFQKQKERFKKKAFKTLSTKEKDELLYLALKQLGLID